MATKTYADTPNSTSNVNSSDLIVVQQGTGLGSAGFDQMKQTTLGAIKEYMAGDPVRALKFKGSCTYALLPVNPSVGDVWNVTDRDGKFYAWNGTTWDSLGIVLDLSGKADKTYVDAALENKADKTYVDAALENKADKTYVDEALENKADKSSIKYVNRNLLDNPFFSVNQRGLSSYSGNNIYSVDRWRLNGNGTVNVNSDKSITIPATTAGYSITILQMLDMKLDSSKLHTLSAIVDGQLLTGSIYPTSTPNTSSERIVFPNCELYLWYEGGREIHGFALKAKANVTIRAVKLELGEKSTLAYDSAPNCATELLKCQRYFERVYMSQVEGGWAGLVVYTSGGRSYFSIQTSQKRLAPSSVTSNYIGLNAFVISENFIRVGVDAGLPDGSGFIGSVFPNGTYIDISADL